MTFEEVKKLDDTYIMHTFKRKPVCFVEGEGVTVKDEEGKEYLDLLSGIGVDSLGHCHPRVAEAIAEQAQKLARARKARRALLPVVELQIFEGLLNGLQVFHIVHLYFL